MEVRNTSIKIQTDIITWYIVPEDHDDKKSKFFKNTEYVKFHERTKKKIFLFTYFVDCYYLYLYFIT